MLGTHFVLLSPSLDKSEILVAFDDAFFHGVICGIMDYDVVVVRRTGIAADYAIKTTGPLKIIPIVKKKKKLVVKNKKKIRSSVYSPY